MINIEGKTVLTELEELVDPAHTALIVIDMQRDFIEPDGLFATLGIDLSMYAESRPRVGSLAGCRPHDRHDRRAPAEHGARRPNERFSGPDPVQSPDAQGRSSQPAAACATRFPVRRGTSSPENSRRSRMSSWCASIVRAASGEPTSTCSCAATASRRSWSAGCTTEGCVESTARDAMFNDFYVVIAEDCVASDDKAQHEASMLLMRHRFDMAAGDEIQRIWQARPGQSEKHR